MESVRVYKTKSSEYIRTRQRDNDGKLISESWTKNGKPIGPATYTTQVVAKEFLEKRGEYKEPKQLIDAIRPHKCTTINGHVVYDDLNGKPKGSNAVKTIDISKPKSPKIDLIKPNAPEDSGLFKIAKDQD